MTTATDDRHLHAVTTDDPTPHPLADTEAEKVVLGSLMLLGGGNDTAAIVEQVVALLRPDDFWLPRHGLIYAAITGALGSSHPTHPVALGRALAETGDLQRVGGGPYLHTLMACVPIAAHAPHYARIVADQATRRRLAHTGALMSQLAGDLTRGADDVVNQAQAALHAATSGTADHGGGAQLSDLCTPDLLAEILDGAEKGISTGLGALDDVIGGLVAGQLVIVAGRPGSGKSVLGVDVARATALKRGIPAAIFSLEMSRKELLQRILAAECTISLTRIRRGDLRYDERARLTAKWDEIRQAPLHIFDVPTGVSDLATLRAVARRTQQRHGLAVVAVDYLQLVRGPGRYASRREEVDEVSRNLKNLAGELELPVLAAAQLNRGPESRTDKRPQLSDLRESGSIEADADIVIAIHREDYYDREHERAGEADLLVLKNRNGAQDVVTVAAQLEYVRFIDYGVEGR